MRPDKLRGSYPYSGDTMMAWYPDLSMRTSLVSHHLDGRMQMRALSTFRGSWQGCPSPVVRGGWEPRGFCAKAWQLGTAVREGGLVGSEHWGGPLGFCPPCCPAHAWGAGLTLASLARHRSFPTGGLFCGGLEKPTQRL